MKRIRLTVAYDGTNYRGSQIQPNSATIEGKLNEAIRTLTGSEAKVIMASRTDAGVHARGNVAVFDTDMKMAADKFAFALNDCLPDDIRIQKSDEVPLGWHPRKQNCVKTYEYRIFNRKIPDPLVRLTSTFCYYDLNLCAMQEAAKALTGEHDFRSFCSSGNRGAETENTVRTIYGISLEKQGDMITLRISGSGFLYNMVRIIAGTLLRIGTGMWPPEKMAEILEKRDRKEAGPCAGASGLTLAGIEFEEKLQPEISSGNKEWSYMLDQRDTEKTGKTYLVIHRCTDAEYAGLLTRELHQAWRNGATEILASDAEKPERLREGSAFGFYTLIRKVQETREAGGVDISTWLTTGTIAGKKETGENID